MHLSHSPRHFKKENTEENSDKDKSTGYSRSDKRISAPLPPGNYLPGMNTKRLSKPNQSRGHGMLESKWRLYSPRREQKASTREGKHQHQPWRNKVTVADAPQSQARL